MSETFVDTVAKTIQKELKIIKLWINMYFSSVVQATPKL